MASNRPIRIVLVLEATEGGTQRYLRELVACLEGREFDVRVVCSLGRDPRSAGDVAGMEARGARVLVLPMVRAPHPILDLVACLRLRRILSREPCDILHLHSSKAGWVGRLAALGLRCKVIYTPHAFSFAQQEPSLLRHAFLLAERLTAARTDVLLAVSPSEARLAIEHVRLEPQRVRVLPNAVHVPGRPEIRPLALGDRSRRFVVGFLGEPRAQKDPLTFLGAVKHVIGAEAHARFLLPWSKPLDDRVRRFLTEHELEQHVELVHCPDGLDPIHEQIRFGVLASRWEGLPFALLDALGRGIPVVGSDIPPLRDVLSKLDAELLFPVGDERALGERLLAWLRAPETRVQDLGARCRELVAREHDIRAWREGIRAVYREAMPPASGPRTRAPKISP